MRRHHVAASSRATVTVVALSVLGLVAPVALAACSSDQQSSSGGDDLGLDAIIFVPDTGTPTDGASPLDDGATATSAGDTASTGTAADPDGTSASDGTTPDTTGPCSTFGCACTSNADCNDSLCVPGLDGLFCTQTCFASCPGDDFACLAVAVGGADPTNACVPLHPNLCKPCRSSSECTNPLLPTAPALCVPAADPSQGSFCASQCSDSIPCPDGFTCGDVPLDGGGVARQCLPTDGMCECRPAWANAGLVTDCTTSNAYGTCGGMRTCGPDGLTSCDAATPASESCNGKDDDCNGKTDDVAPFACTIVNEHGTCPGTAACDGDGHDRCVGTAPAAETCDGVNNDCDAQTDEDTCADALACTSDKCVAAGQCEHPIDAGFCVIDGACVAENAANPNFPCQRCVPAVSQTSWTGGGDTAACYIGGECWPDGAGKPGEPCFRCRPDVSTTTWSAASAADAIACDDGFACTKNDICKGGGCIGEPYSCSDGLGCTEDVCQGDGACRYPIKPGNCLIDGACYADGARPDQTTCRACDADLPTQWSAPASAVACDDQNNCTSSDKCAGANCAGAPFSCDDGLVCTADSCNAGGTCANTLSAGFCLIEGACYADGATSPDNPCLVCKASVSPIFWSAKANGESCDDGNACSYGDKCSFGTCFAVPYDCIGNGCCLGDGTCTNVAPTGGGEICDNGIDDDCDGITDEGQPEICGDHTDNDCDGQVDESANTWGEVFFARGWSAGGTPTIAIYTSKNDGTFEDPKVLSLPGGGVYSIAGVGDFDGDRFNDLIVAQSVYQDGVTRCTSTAQCPANQACLGGGCVPTNCSTDADCQSVPGTRCWDAFELNDAGTRSYCYPPTRVALARERCPVGNIDLLDLFRMDPAEGIATILDVDNDGDLDVVVREHWSLRRGYLMRNDSAGGTIAFTKVTARPGTGEVMLPMPTGTNYPPINAPCSWVYGISKVGKDIDGDGIADLLGNCNPNGGSTPSTLWWWKGRGDGSFAPKQDLLNLNTTPPGMTTNPLTPFGLLTMNDFNRDGKQDIVGGVDDDGNSGAIFPIVGRGSGASLSWLWGTLAYDVMPKLFTADGPGVGTGTSADLDDDGYADLLVGWAPDVPECQNVGNTSCVFAEMAVLKNVTGATCAAGTSCSATGTCASCRGVCDINAECGSDGCGGTCGPGCEQNEVCQGGKCVAAAACTPSCSGKTCGDNGCGGVCGECAAGQGCKAGACVPVAQCGTCVAKTCGSDDCGTPCVFFQESYHIASDTNSRGGEVPTNAPPTRPTVELEPLQPGDGQDLLCAIVVPSFDLDPVRYRYAWYRNNAFFAAASNRPVVAAAQTAPGDTWRCEVVAFDDLEYAPRVVSNSVTVRGVIGPIDNPPDRPR
ncbi:MAG: VCBS repeat-containing protein [Myxococcota bacterium]